MIKTIFQSKRFLIVLLIISLLGNTYLFTELYKANKYDKVQSGNHYAMYVENFQLLSKNMDRVLQDGNDEESYNRLLSRINFLRAFSPVPFANYYGKKHMNELGISLNELTTHVSQIVHEYYEKQKPTSLSKVQQELLQEISKNFKVLSDEFENEQKELVELIENTIEKNNEILVEI